MTRTTNAWWAIVLTVALALPVGTAWAGSLEPPGAPGPTMKTLDEIPGSWSRTLSSGRCGCDPGETCNSDRWRCVLGGAAVLDLETGLVWEESLNLAVSFGTTWGQAMSGCYGGTLGGRGGLRPPTAAELASLSESCFIGSGTCLPSGNPFDMNTGSGTYYIWSATTDPEDATKALALELSASSSAVAVVSRSKSTTANGASWCVRGGNVPQSPQ
jgi:hypothetical protein